MDIIIWLVVIAAALAAVAVVAARTRAARRPDARTHVTTADTGTPGSATERVQRHIRAEGGRT